MPDSNMFQNLVDLASLQQEPPFKSACQTLAEDRPIVLGLRAQGFGCIPCCHMRLTTIYMASCRARTLKKGRCCLATCSQQTCNLKIKVSTLLKPDALPLRRLEHTSIRFLPPRGRPVSCVRAGASVRPKSSQ